MKFTDFQRQSVSLIILLTLMSLLYFWAAPVSAATGAGNSETTIAQGESTGPGFVEKTSSSNPVIKKAKKFPWLIVGLGVVVVGIAAYFLIIKKTKYTLSITMAAGITGTPAATTRYNKGTLVKYNYKALAGYIAQVKLDSVEVPASGTVTMDKEHTLSVTTEPSYTLTVTLGAGVSGTPAATSQYKQGALVNYNYSAAISYGLEVKLDGTEIPASGTITMDKDKALMVTAVLLDIRGTWQLSMVYITPGYSIYNYTGTWAYSGTRESGTFTEIAGTITNRGTYTVTNYENVWFKYDDTSDTFIGKITGGKMSGTFASGSTYNGTWSGTKVSATTVSVALPLRTATPSAIQKPKRG